MVDSIENDKSRPTEVVRPEFALLSVFLNVASTTLNECFPNRAEAVKVASGATVLGRSWQDTAMVEAYDKP